MRRQYTFFTATDLAGNSGSGQIHLRRIAQVTSVMPFAPTSTSLDVDFDTDLVSTGVLVYGTSGTQSLDSVFATSANGLIHNATITGLTRGHCVLLPGFRC